MNPSTLDPRRARLASILLVFVAAAGLVACGSDDDTASAADDGGDTSAADGSTADGGDDTADDSVDDSSDESGDDASGDGGYTDPYGEPGGRLDVGETFDDGEWQAVYLGLAQIPVGPDIFEDGACFAPLFEVTYLDPFDFGSDEFRPSLDAYLLDGTTGERDQTGVGCDTLVLEPAGYARLIDTKIEGG